MVKGLLAGSNERIGSLLRGRLGDMGLGSEGLCLPPGWGQVSSGGRWEGAGLASVSAPHFWGLGTPLGI